MEINKNEFIRSYYDKIYKGLYELKPDFTLNVLNLNLKFSLFKIGNQKSNLYIGLEKEILNNLIYNNKKISESLISINNYSGELLNLNSNNLSIGIDGILLFLDKENQLKGKITKANIAYKKQGIRFSTK